MYDCVDFSPCVASFFFITDMLIGKRNGGGNDCMIADVAWIWVSLVSEMVFAVGLLAKMR
jgi:hypothetical protein